MRIPLFCRNVVLILSALALFPLAGQANKRFLKPGVLAPEARKQTLLEYVAGRKDLSTVKKAEWDKAVRLTFGGKAIQDGTDEGVTVAKSVIAAAIFFRIPPEKGAKAAYQAYHDSYKWIPPPIAIEYQILSFLGRKPKARAWDLAYDFPTHFNEAIAPDIVAWWEEMLAAGKIPDYEIEQVKKSLQDTKAKMKPMLFKRLKALVFVDAWLSSGRIRRVRIKEDLTFIKNEIEKELARSFKGVATSAVVYNQRAPAWDRLVAFAKESGTPITFSRPMFKKVEKPQPKERYQRPRRAPLPGQRGVPLFPEWEAKLDESIKGWLNTPYRYGGSTKKGVDGAGFIRALMLEVFNVRMAYSARYQSRYGNLLGLQELKKGDLLFFDTQDRGYITHVGMYLGDGKMAHADVKSGVAVVNLGTEYYRRAFRFARRILDRK